MLASKNQQETDKLTKSSTSIAKSYIGRCLRRRANINGTNSNSGKSILTIITEGYTNGCYDLDIIHYLLDRGADPFLKDNNGNSMLSIAAAKVKAPLLKIIMERINAKKDVFELFRLFEVHNLQDTVMLEILKQVPSDEILNLLQRCKEEASNPLPKLEECIKKYFPENSAKTQAGLQESMNQTTIKSSPKKVS